MDAERKLAVGRTRESSDPSPGGETEGRSRVDLSVATELSKVSPTLCSCDRAHAKTAQRREGSFPLTDSGVSASVPSILSLVKPRASWCKGAAETASGVN